MTKWSSPVGSDLGRSGASERRVQSHSTPSEAKPGSLWTCGPALSPAATPRVWHRPPDCTRGSPHSSSHPGTLWCWLSSQLQRCDVALTWNHTKDHNHSRKLCFHHPVIHGNPDLHFEGAGNGPVVITWIGREHGCTAAHLRSRSLNIVSLSDMKEDFYCSWDLYTNGQLEDGLQQKKKTGFH